MFQPCRVVGFLRWESLVPKKKGRTYLRPVTGTSEGPTQERFQRAPDGARVERRPAFRNFRGFVTDSSRSYAK